MQNFCISLRTLAESILHVLKWSIAHFALDVYYSIVLFFSGLIHFYLISCTICKTISCNKSPSSLLYLKHCTCTHASLIKGPSHIYRCLSLLLTSVTFFVFMKFPCLCLTFRVIIKVQGSKKKLLTTIKILSDFESTTSSKCPI